MEGDRHRRRDLGRMGEDAACRLLEEMGHVILERNWRSGHLEIDIISCAHDGIHFVEVKSRRSSIQAPPQENVDRGKQQRTVRAAKAYIRKRRDLPAGSMEYIFDVVAVVFAAEGIRAEFIGQAFIPVYL